MYETCDGCGPSVRAYASVLTGSGVLTMCQHCFNTEAAYIMAMNYPAGKIVSDEDFQAYMKK